MFVDPKATLSIAVMSVVAMQVGSDSHSPSHVRRNVPTKDPTSPTHRLPAQGHRQAGPSAAQDGACYPARGRWMRVQGRGCLRGRVRGEWRHEHGGQDRRDGALHVAAVAERYVVQMTSYGLDTRVRSVTRELMRIRGLR